MINKLTRREKIVIFTCIIVLFSGIYYIQFYIPLQEKYVALENGVIDLQLSYLQKINQVKFKLPQTERRAEELKETYLTIIKKYPRQDNISYLLVEIMGLAMEKGLIVEYFSPKTIRSQGEYNILPVGVTFLSDYQGIIEFVYNLEKGYHFIEINNLEIKNRNNIEESNLLQVNLILNIPILPHLGNSAVEKSS